MRCFFVDDPKAGRCSGALVRGHLIPRSLLKREYRYGALLEDGKWRPMKRNEDRYDLKFRSLLELIEDSRSYVPICGGPMGNGGHHGALDQSRRLRIPREYLPAAVEEFAEELGLLWWVEREYGPLLEEAA